MRKKNAIPIMASYSMRRHEAYVFDQRGNMLFSIQEEQADEIPQECRVDDDKLAKWVYENYKTEIDDMVGGVRE